MKEEENIYFEYYKEPSGQYFGINFTLVERIIRTWLYTRALVNYSNVIKKEQPFGPDLYELNFNWEQIKAIQHQNIEDPYLIYVRRFAQQSSQTVISHLIEKTQETRKFQAELSKKRRDLTCFIQQSVENSVRNGEIAVGGARFFRDLSADVLIIGASVATGGAAAVSYLGLGSGLKGIYKYQDTGKIKSSFVETAFSFGLGLLPIKLIPKSSHFSKDMTLNLLFDFSSNIAGEPLKAILSGEELKVSLATGALEITANSVRDALIQQFTNGDGNKYGLFLNVAHKAILKGSINYLNLKLDQFQQPSNGKKPPNSSTKGKENPILFTANYDAEFIMNHVVIPELACISPEYLFPN